MTVLDIAAILICLAAGFGLLNHHLLELPNTIGLVVIALGSSFGIMLLDLLAPGLGLGATVRELIASIDFYEAVVDGMLGFLLFAGALHVDLAALREQKWPIGLMATLGIGLSTAIIGLGFSQLAAVPVVVALVFGALISPTDPVAVLGILKRVKVPASLETKIAGESLFNDGVGVVVFLILVAIAFQAGEAPIGAYEIAELFVVEALGGAALGAVTGWLVYRLLRQVDECNLEVILTLALVMGTYALAQALHISGPIAVVVAGLWIGNHGVRFGMSERTREHVHTFWHLLDEILNAVLFLLIGLEILAIPFQAETLWIAALTIPLVLFARLVAVALPVGLLRLGRSFTKGAVPVMTWGGLRGGISVALVLSLPESEFKPLLVTATYCMVVFSIIVQGLTFEAVIRRFVRADQT